MLISWARHRVGLLMFECTQHYACFPDCLHRVGNMHVNFRCIALHERADTWLHQHTKPLGLQCA